MHLVMNKSNIFFCALFLLAIIFIAGASKKYNLLIGSWTFIVNQAPWEYSRGEVVFEKDKGDVLTGKVIFSSGREIKISKITYEDEKIAFYVFIDGHPVKTTVSLKDNDMSGFVETDDGDMPFSAKRKMPQN